jgi:hypothetical protein
MRNSAIVALVATGLTAAVVGLAAPAQADIGHHDWVVGTSQQAQTPSVDTTVQQSR